MVHGQIILQQVAEYPEELLNMVRISIREVDLNQLKRKIVCRCLHNRFLHTDDMRMNSEATMCLTH